MHTICSAVTSRVKFIKKMLEHAAVAVAINALIFYGKVKDISVFFDILLLKIVEGILLAVEVLEISSTLSLLLT